MIKNIYLYCDEGAGAFSLCAVKEYFLKSAINLVTADDITKNGIPQNIDIFIMPGGADIPYTKKLNGHGNRIIRQYVENGGIYLGICAGAYYGCADIEFQKNTPDQICENRELKFINGTAIGCLPEITKKPYDQTLKSADITTINVNEKTIPTLYWGGCMFNIPITSDASIIARYNDLDASPPAIISRKIGKGLAILSGVHFEVSAKTLQDYDFGNEADNKCKETLAKQLKTAKHLDIHKIIEEIAHENICL